VGESVGERSRLEREERRELSEEGIGCVGGRYEGAGGSRKKGGVVSACERNARDMLTLSLSSLCRQCTICKSRKNQDSFVDQHAMNASNHMR